MTKHDFKIGERVSFNPPANVGAQTALKRGGTGTVKAITWGVQVKWDGVQGIFGVSTESPEHLTLVVEPGTLGRLKHELGGPFTGPYRTTEINKTWIIAVLDNKGKPRPAPVPRVYTSAAQAEAVAKKMAEDHAGETFMVLQGTAVAATPAVKSVELVRL